MAQHFEQAIDRLCNAGLAIPWHTGYQADLTVIISRSSSAQPVAVWRCSAAQQEGCAVRFPYFGPLLDSVEFFVAKGLPAEWWLGDCTGGTVVDASLQPQLEQLQQAICKLEEAIQVQLEAMCEPTECALLWALLEEWALAQRCVCLPCFRTSGFSSASGCWLQVAAVCERSRCYGVHGLQAGVESADDRCNGALCARHRDCGSSIWSTSLILGSHRAAFE